jgi:aryl-alcohol dehydrogenase-like predicted oxidoreductase
MKYRTFGKSGVKVSEVGIGTWQLGNADWGVLDEKEALRILHRAVEQGVNLIDTADVYGLGFSEQIIGKFLKETKEKVYVATKLGRKLWVELKGWPPKYTLEITRKATQESLKRLGVESVFLQQWHCLPTEMLREGEVLEHLETLKKEGLIQNWGCSVESIEEAMLSMKHPGCGGLQVIYNIFRQKLTDELLPAAKKKKVGILARVPLASGLLTGKFKAGHQFSEKDHRNYNKDGKFFNVGETFAGVPFEKGVEFAEKIRAILKPTETVPMAQLALRWILDQKEVSTVIPGATKAAHADSNAAASKLPSLSQKTHEALKELYDREIASAIRGPY